MADHQFSINKEKQQFELAVGDQLAIIEYRIGKPDKMFLVHTEVPTSLERQGIGSSIVKQALQYIRDNEYKLVPLCPFVAAYVKRHPEYRDLLAGNVNI